MSKSDDLTTSTNNGLFAVHGDLDGEAVTEFQEREQFIGLIIAGEEFLLPISAVREIIMLTPITFVPNSPEFVDGVINLRGNIVPVINMRKLMGQTRGQASGTTRIIITKFESVTFGLLVDGITYVVSLLPSEVEHTTLPGQGAGTEFIGSISKQGNKISGILDLARVLKGVGGVLEDEHGDEVIESAPEAQHA